MNGTATADGRRAVAIPDHQIINLPAFGIRPGDVTLYGVVLDTGTVAEEVQLDCWGNHTVTCPSAAAVTVLGRIGGAVLAQLRAQAAR